ncbi:hypothetical protein ACFLRT_04570, partial [Acidobacteriota bacterium]
MKKKGIITKSNPKRLIKMTDSSHIHVPWQGDLKEGDIYSILYYIYKNSISGTLVVNAENVEKKM